MPSFLVPQNEDIYEDWVRRADAISQVSRLRIGSPWQGYTPDLDPGQSSASGFQNILGLVARVDPGGFGEVLMPDSGFGPVPEAATGLPLGTGANINVTLLGMFNRTKTDGSRTADWDKTMLAGVGGDDATAGAWDLYRLVPQTTLWQRVPFCRHASVTAAHESSAGREILPDWAEFPAGAPTRGGGSPQYSGAITEPVFVWCGLNSDGDGDRVMMYPVADAVAGLTIEDGAYEPLNELNFGEAFYAATVEHFGGRLYFGNTSESGTRHRQRVRRTALFTADVNPTLPGSGAFDVRDFSGDLLRLEKLGDLLVAYFEDGVAFIRSTDVATAPDRVQLLREKRGLLSTHAVTSVGAQEHFGIFDDGWFFLDPSGRWTEVGMVDIDGIQTPKWKNDFYDNFDYDNRHRLTVSYDREFVRIAYPKNGNTDNTEIWIFDPRGNRVFKDIYVNPVTVWANTEVTVRSATAWEDTVGTWSTITGSWASYGAKFGLKTLTHGTTTGFVLAHSPDFITKYSTAKGAAQFPSFEIDGMLTSLGDPTIMKRAKKLWVEQIHSNTGAVTLTVQGDNSDQTESGKVSFSNVGIPGSIQTPFRTFNQVMSANLQYSISGTSPVRIRSILIDVQSTESEERLG